MSEADQGKDRGVGHGPTANGLDRASWSDIVSEALNADRPPVAEADQTGIGIVGAGTIVETGHLPAYSQAGFRVVGIFDLNLDRASRLSARYKLARVYPALEDCLEDPDVAVVDIAVPPTEQARIARDAIRAGKHVLCQKPLAMCATDAAALVRLAEENDVRLAVNQQFRWDQGMAATRYLVRNGVIGHPRSAYFHIDKHSRWDMAWLTESPELDLRLSSIHYLDAIRSVFGNPVRVFASTAGSLLDQVRGDTRSISVLQFEDERQAWLYSNHENRAGDTRAEFRVDGTEGSIKGKLGSFYKRPQGGADDVRVHSASSPHEGWFRLPITREWFPDAFRGPMASLINWIVDGAEAETSGRDNLWTLATVDALYKSAELRSAVTPCLPQAESQVIEGQL